MNSTSARTITAVLAAAALGAACMFFIKQPEAARLRSQNEELLAEQVKLTSERDTATAAAAASEEALRREQADKADLLRLRNEVSTLRKQNADVDKLKTENQNLRSQLAANRTTPAEKKTPPPALQSFPRDQWAFAGYANPEATLQSAGWAMSNGDVKTFLAAMTPEEREKVEAQFRGRSEAEMATAFKRMYEATTYFSITSRDVVSDDEVILGVYEDGRGRSTRLLMKRINNEWKMAGPPKSP